MTGITITSNKCKKSCNSNVSHRQCVLANSVPAMAVGFKGSLLEVP